MLTLNQEIARLKETRNLPALQEMSASMQDTIDFTKSVIAKATDNPQFAIESSKRNLAQAEKNLALVQNAVESISN